MTGSRREVLSQQLYYESQIMTKEEENYLYSPQYTLQLLKMKVQNVNNLIKLLEEQLKET